MIQMNQFSYMSITEFWKPWWIPSHLVVYLLINSKWKTRNTRDLNHQLVGSQRLITLIIDWLDMLACTKEILDVVDQLISAQTRLWYVILHVSTMSVCDIQTSCYLKPVTSTWQLFPHHQPFASSSEFWDFKFLLMLVAWPSGLNTSRVAGDLLVMEHLWRHCNAPWVISTRGY